MYRNFNMSVKFFRVLKQFFITTRTCCHLYENKINLEKPFKRQIKHLQSKDNIFSQAMLSVKSRKTRLKSGLIVLEGRRLIQDAVKAGLQPKMIFYSRKVDLDTLENLDEGVEIYKIPYETVKLWSNLTTPPGILAFCEKPQQIPTRSDCLPVTVVCDQVREPGNLGAVIRCAAGAGVREVLLMKGCADHWDSKVLRGASGASFRLPVYNEITWDNLFNYINPNANFLLAANQPTEVEPSLPCFPYYQLNYKDRDVVIVIGGETEGLSQQVISKARELNGVTINIPLSNEVESLNCVSAMSIILFEIKRQLIL